MYKDEITRISQEIHGKLVDIRRDIHMHPELAYEEFRTTEKIYSYLKSTIIARLHSFNKS